MLGRRKLGDYLPITILTKTISGGPLMPDAPPFAFVYNSSGTVVATVQLPPVDQFNAPGLFQLQLFLGSAYAVGLYRVSVHYTISGTANVDEEQFEIVAGGNAEGTINSLDWYHCPQADFILQQLTSGQIVQGRNAYL